MSAVVTVFGLASRYIGGSENYARELSLQLSARGRRSVFCFLEQPPDEVLQYLDLPDTSVEVLEDSDVTRPSLATIGKLSRILRKHEASILHLHLVGFVGPYPWVARMRSVERVYFTHHMSQTEGYIPRRAPWWKRRVVRVINWPMSAVICVSQYNYNCMTTFDLLPADRFKRIYNGVDFARVTTGHRGEAFRRQYGIPQGRVLVGQVSWIIPEKGVGDLLEAAGQVLLRNPNVHFVFVGEGGAREEFMQQAEQMGLADHVSWTGLVQDPFAEGLYDAADIVCQPSRWEEAFGQVIAEAMAFAKPVIGTNVGGIPEVIADGVSGFVIARGDVQALAEKIVLLSESPELRRQMGTAGAAISRERFDLRQNVKELVDLYTDANPTLDPNSGHKE